MAQPPSARLARRRLRVPLFACAIATAIAPAQHRIAVLPPADLRVVGNVVELRAQSFAAGPLVAFLLGYHARNDGGGGLFFWDAASGQAADGGLVFTSTVASAPPAGRWLRIFSGPVDLAWWGLAGDGSDETPALQAAFDAAAGRGIVLRAPRTYGFRPPLTVRADTRVQNNGAKLRLLADPGGTANAILMDDHVRADLVRVEVAAGVSVRRLLSVGNDCDIRDIEITSPSRQGNTSNSLNGALQIRTDRVRLGRVTIVNFDFAVLAYQASRVVIERIDIRGYVNGFHARESAFLELLSAEITVPSAVATTQPGHNGILFDQCNDVVVSDAIIHDAGEHAIRIGGAGISSRFVFSNIQAIRPGQCGLKINPDDGFRVRDVQINGLTVVDAAATSTPGSNEDGLRLEKCSYVTVNGLQVEKRDRAVSAFDGIFVNGCEFVTINGPRITDVRAHGIHLQDVAGPVNEVFINNPSILFTGGDGIFVESPTQVLRDITVMRCYIRGCLGWGIRLVANSPSVGVNQPVILDGWVKNEGVGAVFVSTSDPDVHRTITVVN